MKDGLKFFGIIIFGNMVAIVLQYNTNNELIGTITWWIFFILALRFGYGVYKKNKELAKSK